MLACFAMNVVLLAVDPVAGGLAPSRASQPLTAFDVAELQAMFHDRQGQVTFVDPARPEQLMRSRGKLLMETDRVIVTGPQGSYQIPLSQIRELDASRPVRGAALGLAIGVVVGAALGVTAGLTSSKKPGSSWLPSDAQTSPPPRVDRKRETIEQLTLMVPVAALAGAVIGLFKGRRPVVRISPAPAPP